MKKLHNVVIVNEGSRTAISNQIDMIYDDSRN